MVSIESLHIGSHVLFNGERVEICTLDALNGFIGMKEHCGVAADGMKFAVAHTPDHFDPIPITEELLTELGFEYKSIHYGMYWVYEEIRIEECGEWWSVEIDGDDFSVRYLHELEAFVYLTTKQRLI